MKIALLGAAGGVGQALALLLKLQLPANSTMALYDIAPSTIGIAVDLGHIPTAVTVSGYCGSNASAALQDADVVIMAAGGTRKPHMERTDLLSINATITCSLLQQVISTAPHACIGIISNPVNSLVAIAAEQLARANVYDKDKLFGITTLDATRAGTMVAELTSQSPASVMVPVIGGHSATTILPLFSQVKGIALTEQQIIALTQRVQNAGTEVLHAKDGSGTATLAMAHAGFCFILSLVRALQGEPSIEVYAYVESDASSPYSRFFAQPVLLGTTGIVERRDIGPLSPFEQHYLAGVLATLRAEISSGEKFFQVQEA